MAATVLPIPATSAPALPVVVAVEKLRLPPELDGSAGRNRGNGLAQISAGNDPEAVGAWLAQFVDSAATLANYRKETERLMLWATLERGKPLSSLTHDDFLAYRAFLADPRPAERWVQQGGKRLGRSHVGWRPFAGPLSPASVRQALVILNALLSWLVEAGYLAGNPLALSRQRRHRVAPRVVRYLEADLWAEVVATIEALPRTTERESEHADRVRWLFSLFYLAGLRISEVAQNTMGGFFARRANAADQWWLELTGKGDKVRRVPVADELMAELIRYRRAHRLPALPHAGDQTPLVLPIGGRLAPLKRAALHGIVKGVFEAAARRIEAENNSAAGLARAARLRQASAHWLRHTSGSHMTDAGVDLRFVRDNLGHESLTTTSGYLHAEDDPRHRATVGALRMGWRESEKPP